MKIFVLYLVLLFLFNYGITLNLPGPRVYVVTPSSRLGDHEGRSAPQPFYYHNWMRRMDTPRNDTTTSTTTTAPKVKTPDLIFAEFEADKMKNIRKLLEKEKLTTTTTTTTSKPIYVPDEETRFKSSNYGLPSPMVEKEENKKDMTDYFAYYNNLYNSNNNAPPAPVYQPSTTTTTTVKPTTPKATTTSKTTSSTTTSAPVNNVENIWHIIDSEKLNQYSGQWDEVPLTPDNGQKDEQNMNQSEPEKTIDEHTDDDEKIDSDFALPGFATQPLTPGENESRAIRTEPNIRFPYVNLKPFQLKSSKKPLGNMFPNSKKGNNMFTNLDNFVEVKNPVRGEVQDVGPKQHPMMNVPIDRYNPAQPYLPGPSEYGSKSKQSSPSSGPVKTYANLVPPPPPQPPKLTDNDFPAPITYESFPPFAPSGADSAPPPPPAPAPRPPMVAMPQAPMNSDSDSGPDSDGPLDFGYQYKAPAPPTQSFLPTLPPLIKAFRGYSYDKPPMADDAPSPDMGNKPDFQGYTYNKPPATPDKPTFQGYSYEKPSAIPDKPSYGYHYDKPEPPAPPKDHGVSFDHPPKDDSDYPELIYGNNHGSKGADDTKADHMGMLPPPMSDMKPGMDAHGPPDDSGFPPDFPGDFKYHFDFDHDHDYYHHHHHPTTTTTTEMPRVNRYSYYYLGKKLYYLPLYFSVYFIVYVGALIIKAVLRHKIVYPNSWRPNDQTAGFFSKRSVDSMDFSKENLHEITGRVTHAIATAAERYIKEKNKED